MVDLLDMLDEAAKDCREGRYRQADHFASLFETSAREIRVLRPICNDISLDGFDIENYIKNLNWSSDADDYHKTLVAGNLRGLLAAIGDYVADINTGMNSNSDDVSNVSI